LIVAHEDQPDGLYGRGGSERIESASASDRGGIQAAVGSLEAVNGFRPERSRYVYGALMMDISRHEVLVHGREVGLTRKEFNLLECLLNHPGHVRSRDALLNAVWGYDYYGTARTVDVHIRRLKQKLPLLDRAIVCVRGLGYKLKDTRDEEADIPGVR
jgi:DNA-binding response OmpR family regulator